MSSVNATAARGKSVRFGEGQVLMVLGMPHIIKVQSEQNAAGASVMEVVVAPGQGVPPHIHTREDEFFCILQGELTCQMQGAEAPVTLKAGDFLFLPRNQMHGFLNTSGKEARMLVTVSPGAGTDRMFADLERACQKYPCPQQLMPEVARICGECGVSFVGT